MADLISREAAKYIVSLMICAPSVKILAEHAIDTLPTMDAVPVVRCRDCKYWKDQSGTPKWLPCVETQTSGMWFCADGKRREVE